jgi:hypothetical protein
VADLCEQPVEKPVTVAKVHPHNNLAPVARAAPRKPSLGSPADALGKLIDEKSPDEFHAELDNDIDHTEERCCGSANLKRRENTDTVQLNVCFRVFPPSFDPAV